VADHRAPGESTIASPEGRRLWRLWRSPGLAEARVRRVAEGLELRVVVHGDVHVVSVFAPEHVSSLYAEAASRRDAMLTAGWKLVLGD
jgi:hypothetical protein